MTEVAGRLEDRTLLPVVERHLLHIVERELPEVYLSVLRIPQCHPVVGDTQVMGTHRTDVHRLDAAHTPIVLQLDAREIAQRVGHGMGVQLLQLLPFQLLTGHHLTHGRTGHDDDLPYVLYGIQLALCCRMKT